MDMGKEARLAILEKNALRILRFAQQHKWTVEKEDIILEGEYILYKIQRKDIVKKIAFLYSQSTKREVYRILEKTVDIIVLHLEQVEKDNFFSKDCTIPVLSVAGFEKQIVEWNGEFDAEIEDIEISIPRQVSDVIRIVEENPLEQIIAQLRALTSAGVAKKSVQYHAELNGDSLSEEIIDKKAAGVAFLVQNALDYYEKAPLENLTHRMLNLYYGTLAFMEAEMLIKGVHYQDLAHIENVTKRGHGLYTLGDAREDMHGFYISVLKSGLFQAWLAQRGIDVADFPQKRKDEPDEYCYSLDQLLYTIPELSNLLQQIDDKYKAAFLSPVYNWESNPYHKSIKDKEENTKKREGSYIILYDFTNTTSSSLVDKMMGDFTEKTLHQDEHSGACGYRVFISHKEKYWHQALNIHKGAQGGSTILLPFLGKTDDWEVYMAAILYSFSIIVRYRPNIWGNILQGSLDKYKAVCYQIARIAERNLPEIFLEKLTGKKVITQNPNGII